MARNSAHMAPLLPVPSWHQRHTPHTRDAGIFAHHTKDSIIKKNPEKNAQTGKVSPLISRSLNPRHPNIEEGGKEV